MLAEALGGGGGRVEKFLRNGWARPWPVGVEMLCYMFSHEAHHRGQVCMLAHQLGFPLPIEVTSGIWNWEKLWGTNLGDNLNLGDRRDVFCYFVRPLKRYP
jgi:hypothetical protein